MDREFLETLWELRFEKMKKNEADAAWKYQGLLNECVEAWGSDNRAAIILSTLVREERAHEKLVEYLIDILKSYKDKK